MRFINQRENLTVETGKIEGMCKIKQTNTVELTEEQQTIWYDMNSKNRLHQRVPHSIPSPHQTSNARWFVPRVFFSLFSCVFFSVQASVVLRGGAEMEQRAAFGLDQVNFNLYFNFLLDRIRIKFKFNPFKILIIY